MCWTTSPRLSTGDFKDLGDMEVWLGLINSDDQGTRFDLQAEVYKNGSRVSSGE